MSTTPFDEPVKQVGAVVHAIAILRTLAHTRQPAGAAAISRETGISVSTCFNILRTLAKDRLVDFDNATKTYRLGMGMLEFSIPLLGVNQAEIIRPELERLADTTRCLICLWHVAGNDRIVLVDRISSAHIVRIDARIGARLPALVGAVGRCYAAHLRLDRRELERRFAPLRWQQPPSFDEYARDVAQAEVDGFAVDDERLFSGIRIMAALVTDARNTARYGLSAIAIGGQVAEDEMRTIAVTLRDSADWISETLFGVPAGRRQTQRAAAEVAPPLPSRNAG